MGFFSSLFGNGSRSMVHTLEDRIWISRKAKFKGLSKQLREEVDAAVILLVAHFEDTLEQLTEVAAGYSGTAPVQATLADNLSTEIAARLNLDTSTTVVLIVAERHPLLSADSALLQFAEEIPCKCRVVYHVSLEDPVLGAFMAGFPQKILDSLGMTEDDPVESGMITRRIKSAQQKIESTAMGNSQATSAAEWLELNAPST